MVPEERSDCVVDEIHLALVRKRRLIDELELDR